ncbi:hypothetical protein C8F04DRAFT_1275981 [Mycena alexandri]|uniref:Uncharacterized protein n=1 Tax=Mycena alexandri TaxID=1745969 RepID=A0AAD6WNW6_9AGAR|nr:hypothetical protein C8F04DRAFT_1275981 [Mycena alexandri]
MDRCLVTATTILTPSPTRPPLLRHLRHAFETTSGCFRTFGLIGLAPTVLRNVSRDPRLPLAFRSNRSSEHLWRHLASPFGLRHRSGNHSEFLVLRDTPPLVSGMSGYMPLSAELRSSRPVDQSSTISGFLLCSSRSRIRAHRERLINAFPPSHRSEFRKKPPDISVLAFGLTFGLGTVFRSGWESSVDVLQRSGPFLDNSAPFRDMGTNRSWILSHIDSSPPPPFASKSS